MEAIYWHHNDHLGTPQALTDINGTVVWTMSQTPFGIATVNEDPDGDGIKVTNNFRFPGQYFDAETGLNYNYQRTYDPAIGGYTQHDPIGLNGGLNPFGYVGGNPTVYIDRAGLYSLGKAVRHYFFGSGKPIDVNFSQIDIGLSPQDFRGFMSIINSFYDLLVKSLSPRKNHART